MKVWMAVLLLYVFSILVSPFPLWRTYRTLWQYVLKRHDASITLQSRLKQAKFLLKALILNPLWTALWYVDELLYPDYQRQRIRPVFIIGQPRSGTTFLHRTLATDRDNFVATRHIEWRYPFIVLQQLFEKFSWARRLLEKNYWPDTEEGRLAAKMHPNTLSDWEEDGIFFEENFLHHFFIFLRFPYPDLLSFVDDFPALSEREQAKMLHIHRKVIQKVLYLRGAHGQFYLSKEVTSHNKMERILALYPDARFVVSVRPSRGYMNSLQELMRYSTKTKTGIDPITIPGWESAFMSRMRRDSLMLTDLCQQKIRDDRQFRVLFDRFTQDVHSSVQLIYRWLGCEMSEDYRAYLHQSTSHQHSRQRGYHYIARKLDGFEAFDEFVEATRRDFDALLEEQAGLQSSKPSQVLPLHKKAV